MRLAASFARILSGLRGFLAPRYQPERHYMRGPGPACSRKHRTSGKLALAD
jgi:hypothetical protein